MDFVKSWTERARAMTRVSWDRGRHLRLRRSILLLRAVYQQAVSLELGSTAASLSFLSLVAIVPIASIMLLVLASVPAFAEWRERIQAFLAANLLLPQVADAVSGYVNQFAGAAGQLSLLSLLLFLATAFTTLLTVEHTMNRIWRTARPRALLYRLASYWLVMTLGPVVLAALIALNVYVERTLSRIGMRLDLHLPAWLPWLPWLFTTLLLSAIYRFMPHRPVRWRDAILGAALAAALLEGLKRLMSLYVLAFPTYQIVYGAFSVLPVFLVWLYALWLAVLVGALIAANAGFAETDVVLIRGPRDEFDRARRILQQLAAQGPGGSVAVSDFGPLFGNSALAAERVGAGLARLGYIVRVWPVCTGSARTQVWNERWFAGEDFQRASLRRLHHEIWKSGRLSSDGTSPGNVAHPDDRMLDAPIVDSSGVVRTAGVD